MVGELRHPCRLEGKAAAYAVLKEYPPRLFWLDSTPFATVAVGARMQGADLVVYGISERAVSIRDYTVSEKKVADYTNQDYEDLFKFMRLGDEAQVAKELFAVRISIGGREEARDFLGAGLPIIPAGVVEYGGKAAVYGTVGLRPLWMPR